MKNKIILAIFSSLLILTGCGGSNNNQTTQSSVETLSNTPADSGAVTLDDITKLKNDLSTLFGDADGDPLIVEDNNSVQDVIDRGGS